MNEFSQIRCHALACASAIAITCCIGGVAYADDAAPVNSDQETVIVTADKIGQGNFTQKPASLPLGDVNIADLPFSVTTVPEDLIVDDQARTVNDILRYLPSVEIRDQQGLEVSRPQSRGFEGSVYQSTRIDGLSIVGTSALPAEDLAGIQVLNGMSGFLYGPTVPAGVFDFQLKRPTDTPLYRAIGQFESDGMFTGQADIGGRTGFLGYRVNLLYGSGESYASGSDMNRFMASGDFDIHLDDRTVIELDGLHYQTKGYGLGAQITYAQGSSKFGSYTVPASFKVSTAAASIPLPEAIDPATPGFGQSYGGSDLTTDLGVMKVKRDLGDGWKLEAGVLYQNALRGVYGIQDDLLNATGDYVVLRNYTSAPRFTALSNIASLTGSVDLFGFKNDLTLATNGVSQGQYSGLFSDGKGGITATSAYVDGTAGTATPTANCSVSGAAIVVLGYGNINHPSVLPNTCPNVSPTSNGMYRSGTNRIQSLILNDAFHINDQWTLQGGVAVSFLESHTFSYVEQTATSGASTATSGTPLENNGEISPTVSLTYKPISPLTLYTTFADNVEQGSQAGSTNANANAFLPPTRDYELETGAKYQFNPDFLITLDGFRMTQAFAGTDANNLYTVVGTQRNWGAELFGAGSITPDVSLFGGVTYIDARLLTSGTAYPAAAYDKRVIGVPNWKSDITLDVHPELLGGLAFTGTLHYESDRAATNTNNYFAPAYATVDLGARYSLALWDHHESIRFNVTNVGNKFYWSSIADGSGTVGSNGANTAFAAPPRTFLLSLAIDY